MGFRVLGLGLWLWNTKIDDQERDTRALDGAIYVFEVPPVVRRRVPRGGRPIVLPHNLCGGHSRLRREDGCNECARVLESEIERVEERENARLDAASSIFLLPSTQVLESVLPRVYAYPVQSHAPSPAGSGALSPGRERDGFPTCQRARTARVHACKRVTGALQSQSTSARVRADRAHARTVSSPTGPLLPSAAGSLRCGGPWVRGVRL